MKDLYCC